VDIIRIEYRLVTYRNTYQGGPAAYFADVSQGMYVIIYVLQTLLGDAAVAGSTFYLPVYICYRNAFLVTDLSLLCRLESYLGHHPTQHVVVWRRRLGYSDSGTRIL
jgi:hypothetical protein